jgi:uncharacterized protein YlbG (UPF0298 family)
VPQIYRLGEVLKRQKKMKYLILLVNVAMVVAQQRFQHQQAQHQHQQVQQPAQQQQQQQVVDSKYRNIPIISQESDSGIDGTFSYSFEGGDGTRAQQNGQLKYSQFEPNSAGEAVQGGYSYTGDDGKVYTVNYVADENGTEKFLNIFFKCLISRFIVLFQDTDQLEIISQLHHQVNFDIKLKLSHFN